jgi:hypothetical protein
LFWVVVVVVGNLLLLELMLTLSGQIHDVDVTEHFDNPSLPDWEHNSNASVSEGVLRMEPGAYAFTNYGWGNVSLTVRARRWGKGALTISYRAGDKGSYNVRFGDLSVSLIRVIDRNTVELVSVPVSVPAGVWVTVHVMAIGNLHAVSLDGKTILKYDDPNPFPTTMIGLLNNGPGQPTGEFDELQISGDSNLEVVADLLPSTENPSPGP